MATRPLGRRGRAIGDDCTAAGVVNPSNACQICDPARDAQGWSNNDGIECDDGLFCTQVDHCDAGTCSGAARSCDDGIACNGVSECDEAIDACSPGVNQCETGFLCDATSGDCVSTCDGCNILANGAEQAGNSCLAVQCWGVNTVGQLGYGHTNTIGDDAADFPLRDIDFGGRRVVQIDAGGGHTCAILDGGAVRCWGGGFGGGLGYGDVTDRLAPPAADVDVGSPAHQIATGSSHTCAVIDGGSLRCWGLNDSGQLGYGHTQNIGDDETPAQAATRMVPQDPATPNGQMRPLGGNVPVGGPVQQVQIRQGLRGDRNRRTCALLVGGGVRCWGSGDFAGLGYAHRNNIGDNETPAEAATINLRQLPDGTSLVLGGNLALGGVAIGLGDGGDQCALLSDDRVLCWRGAEQAPTVADF